MYMPTNEDMFANAYNNWRREHVGDKVTVAPQATFAKYGDHYKRLEYAGFRTISLDCITSAELKVAMEWYRDNTDWSAFTRCDWEAAYAALNASLKEHQS